MEAAQKSRQHLRSPSYNRACKPGIFIPGQTGAYTITVTNSGTAATSGVVTVTDTLPAFLTATGFSGTGGQCGPNLTCTRADAPASGASYPALTLTVNIAGNANGTVANSATVSGGGETNTGNDQASDPPASATRV